MRAAVARRLARAPHHAADTAAPTGPLVKGQGPPSLIEYALVLLVLLLVGGALLLWLQAALADPAFFSPMGPIGVHGLR